MEQLSLQLFYGRIPPDKMKMVKSKNKIIIIIIIILPMWPFFTIYHGYISFSAKLDFFIIFSIFIYPTSGALRLRCIWCSMLSQWSTSRLIFGAFWLFGEKTYYIVTYHVLPSIFSTATALNLLVNRLIWDTIDDNLTKIEFKNKLNEN